MSGALEPTEQLVLPGKEGLTRLSVKGFKAIAAEQSIDIKPLTILAGANSSGKSSMLQPFLLLKQTLEASFDPDPLLLNGANVKFASVDEFLSRSHESEEPRGFELGLQFERQSVLCVRFVSVMKGRLTLDEMRFIANGKETRFRPGLSRDEALAMLPDDAAQLYGKVLGEERGKLDVRVVRERCFLSLMISGKGDDAGEKFGFVFSPASFFEPYIRGLIHVPALRGNPARSYQATGTGPTYPGTFETYVASIIEAWKTRRDSGHTKGLSRDLKALELTWKAEAERVDDTQVRLRVGRLRRAVRGGASDLVNIADVGFGVSQVLPVVVALQAALPRQLVYIEQPEIHLHPRAQYYLSGLLANAANRGVRVIVETHSGLLLLGIQALVAEDKLASSDVKLHWFQRDDQGVTSVTSAELDRTGSFGDWPADFGEVDLEFQKRYLDAVQTKLFR